MIFHSVFFRLKYGRETAEELNFLKAAQKLSDIPGVRNFQVLKQTSVKNNFDYGLIMEFDDQRTYDDYSNHADHLRFIEQFWLNSVADFLEIDYEKISIE